MKLKEIFQQLSHLKVAETRIMGDEYVELVFLNMDLGEWYKILAENLGEPRKPAGREPSEKDRELTRRTGGIWPNQTLFEKHFGHATVIAKFWPWGDDVHTTLKMALLIH